MYCKYSLIQNNHESHNSPHTTYGICVTDGVRVIEEIPDISPNREQVNELVSLCNRLKLSSIHLHDVVEDFF